MNHIRDNHYLSDEVDRSTSIIFMEEVIVFCENLKDALLSELSKHGEKS